MAPFFALSMPGMGELLIILVIVMIFFGVGRLPAVLGEMGKGIKAFKDGVKDGEDPERPKEIDVTPRAPKDGTKDGEDPQRPKEVDVTPRAPTADAEEVREKG